MSNANSLNDKTLVLQQIHVPVRMLKFFIFRHLVGNVLRSMNTFLYYFVFYSRAAHKNVIRVASRNIYYCTLHFEWAYYIEEI